MNKLRLITILSFIGINIVWGFFFVDQSVTLDYTISELNQKKQSLLLLAQIVLDAKEIETKDKLLDITRKKFSNHTINVEDSIIYVDEIGFKYDRNNRLTNIVFMND